MEPCQRTVYDVLLHNLKISGRKTYIHRYIYAGEHKGEKETEEAFTKIIKATNETYCEEKITGVLLLYPNYFVHVFDGDEITYGGHIMRLLHEYNDLFGEIRILTLYHHINQRFFDEWGVRKAKPPILLEKIDPASDYEELNRYLGIFIKKVYNLSIELRQVDPECENPTTIGEIMPYMNQYLPEYTLLNFLVNQDNFYSLRVVPHYENLLLDLSYLLQNIWPVRNDYVPYDVFCTEINPIPNLPSISRKYD